MANYKDDTFECLCAKGGSRKNCEKGKVMESIIHFFKIKLGSIQRRTLLLPISAISSEFIHFNINY